MSGIGLSAMGLNSDYTGIANSNMAVRNLGDEKAAAQAPQTYDQIYGKMGAP